MKTLDIALKDLRHSFRNASFLVFGFALPLLTSGLFYFAFGGLASDEGGFELPVTPVQVVNLDEGQWGFSAGQILVETLQQAIPGVLKVTEAPDAASARAAVDRQEAAAAVIIPPDFTAVAFASQGRTAVEVYQDPTLTLGPSIVKDLVSQLVDGFAGSTIVTTVAYDQLTGRGVAVDTALLAGIAQQYGDWATRLGESYQGGTNPALDIQSPGGDQDKGNDELTRIIGSITAGMMVFYVFFTGAASAQSILREEEGGTLPRLFTTPTPQSTILGGKFVSTFLLLAVQVTVLLAASSLIFGIAWGEPLAAALVAGGLVVLAAGFGIFLTSLLKDTRQTGIVYGGVLTVLGMVGMASVFTGGAPTSSDAVTTLSLLVPQGWGVRGWQLLLAGGGALTGDVLLTVAVTLTLGAVFFVVGVLKFRKRFA